MKPARIVTSGTVGTLFMTLYSYWRSRKENKQYREPQLLSGLLEGVLNNKGAKSEIGTFEGWASHLAVGEVYTLVYDMVWRKTKIKPGILSGVLMGAISGGIGVLIWKKVFEAHPNPPKTDFKGFYQQLFVAHIVFGITSALSYKGVKKLEE